MMRQRIAMRASILAVVGAVLCAAVAVAQDGPSLGLWEAWDPSLNGTAHHWTLELLADGSFRRVDLAGAPGLPLAQEEGSYSATQGSIVLQPYTDRGIGALDYLADGDAILLWNPGRNVSFRRARHVDASALVGVWRLRVNGVETGSTMILNADGTYDADLGTHTEHGPYFVSGSGMVQWPTESTDEALLGVPGVWTDIVVDDFGLSHTITTGARIEGRRATTAVARRSWAQIRNGPRP